MNRRRTRSGESVTIFLPVVLAVMHCTVPPSTVSINGTVTPYFPQKRYRLTIWNTDPFVTHAIATSDTGHIRAGKVAFEFPHDVNFTGRFELAVDDTVRCILEPAGVDYLRNPVTREIFTYRVENLGASDRITFEGLKFPVDTNSTRYLDYNLQTVEPTMEIHNNPGVVRASVDSLPPGATLYLRAQGASQVQEFEFQTAVIEARVGFPMESVYLWAKSRFGWKKLLGHLDMKAQAAPQQP